MTERLRLFVACAPGLEELLADELDELGVEETASTVGGVSCFGDLDTVYRINLGCGLGLRVLVRVAEFFVRDFAKLERVAKALEWERWLSPDHGVRVRGHAKRSRLYHSKAIAQRIERGIERRTGGRVRARVDAAAGPGGGELGEGEAEPTLVQVRIVRDRCTISVDTTGTLLHKRGWRRATAKAPLREDIARALLRVSGWQPGMGLFDPFAGSGTLVIEAATLAAGTPPGRLRRFSFMQQPGFDAERFAAVRAELEVEVRLEAPAASLLGADRDAGAVEAARANAARAGVEERVEFIRRSLGDAELPELTGRGVALVANPPWGLRTGDPSRLRNLYASFGKLARRLPGPVYVGLVTNDPALAGATKLGLSRRVVTDHGGVKIGLWTGVLD
jgi:putative N6-adenine-specific DNA methylase